MSANRRHILLVDDDADIRTVARLSLDRIGGFEVSEAGNGTDALLRLTAGDIDVVLLDVSLPDMDGPSLLEMIREDSSHGSIAVFFFTAHVLPEERAHLESLGADGFIEKPFDPVAMPHAIRSRLQDMEMSERLLGGPWDLVVRRRIEELWENHKESLLVDLARVDSVVNAWTSGAEPSEGVVVSAREAIHRLCGAFGVYGREAASVVALRLHEIVTSEVRDGETLHRTVVMLEELRRLIEHPQGRSGTAW